MSHTITIRGVTGSLRWGYHVAGTLSAWRIERVETRWTLTATIDASDAFRLTQRPLVFEAPHAQGVWRWPIRTLQIEGVSLTATLGPKDT